MGTKIIEVHFTARDGTKSVIRNVAGDIDKVGKSAEKSNEVVDEMKKKINELATTYFGLQGAIGAARFAWDGFTVGAGIEQSQMAVQTLTGSVAKGNAIFDEAIKFGQKYGYTQQEMASAASQAATIINKTNQSTEKSLEVLGRLASLNPAEGFEGAVIAFKELASGDITSIAERFNIARGEANAMKDAIADGADPVATLDAALAKMGVTVDVLGNRMEGRNGALLDMKLSMESLSLATGNLLEALNISEGIQNFANGVGFLSQGVNVLAGNTQELTNAIVDLQVRGFALGNYDLYVQKMQEAGLADEILSREAYNAAGALISKGTAANTASTGVVGLADAEAVLRDMLLQQVNAGQISEGQMSNLIQRTMELAATNPVVSASLLEMITQMSDSGAGAEELTQALDALAINQEFAASKAFGYADAQAAAYDATVQSTDAAAVHTATIFQLSDAEYENAEAKLQQGLAAERSIQFEQDLALAVAMSADGALDAEIASIRLAQAYGIERSEAANLIAMTNQLNTARSGRMGSIAGNALEGALNQVAGTRSGAITAPYVKRSSRRGGGGRSGKSEEVKEREKTEKELDKAEKKITEARERYLEKREQLERDHAARVADINRKAIEERLKAERTLQTNQFDSRADFYTYVAGLDQSQRQEAIARYEELWATQAKLVEQGKIKEAEAYRQAAQEELQADLERAAAMRDIQKQLADSSAELTQAQRDDLAEQLLLLQKADQTYDDQAKSRLDGIKNSADSIEQARQEELAKEQGDYAEAGAKIKDEFDSVVRDVVDDAGQLADAVRQMADRLAVEAGRIISAASAVGGYAGSGVVDAGSDMAAMNVPSFDVGTGDAGLPHNMLLYGHEREIIATPRQSDQVRGLGGLDSLIRTGQQQRQQRPSDAMVRDSGPSTSRAGTGSGGVTMPIQVVVNGGGGAAPIIDVGLLKRDIEAAVNKRLDEDRKRKIMRG